jgi:putative phosphoribosyl transferase
VARNLGAQLDVFVVRKLGLPNQPELAMGAIATGGVRVLNDEVIQLSGVSDSTIEAVARAEEEELKRRENIYRGGEPPISPRDRSVLLIDDGLATGASMRAAIAAVRKLKPSKVVVAVPVGAPATCRSLAAEVDELVCIRRPDPFQAVGLWYDNFDPTSDEDVHRLLMKAREFGH